MDKWFAIGLMSGTSLDGLDICYSAFSQNTDATWYFEILIAETITYPDFWEHRLKNATACGAADLYALNSDYGFYLGEQVADFVRRIICSKST